MKKLITISREYGSGGRLVGQLVAKELSYEFYDKEIIDMAAKESGLSADFIAKTEQKISSSWLYNLLVGSTYAGGVSTGKTGQAIGGQTNTLPLADQVFNAQRKTILSIAKKGPCVIVGRCADYILSSSDEVNRKDLLNVFIYGKMEEKIKRIETIYKDTESAAKKKIIQIDKHRANHYNTFTDNVWGDRTNYDLMINTSTLGIEEAAKLIAKVAENV